MLRSFVQAGLAICGEKGVNRQLSDIEISKIQELIYELRVGEVLQKKAITVTPSTPMRELREVLRDNRISGTPVVENNRLVGMISMEDFIKWLTDGGQNCSIADRMTRNITTVYKDDPLIQAVNKLERFGFGRLPVLARETGELIGVITKGDIIVGLLKKLDVDYRHVEMSHKRTSHIFEGIVAHEKVLILEYQVSGGDFSKAGTSASGLKTTLKRLGISPREARRAAIATYEAEMNLIFFTNGGEIRAKITPDMIRLDVRDDGPGIADIEKAMQPGFSTAPDWVRELGFGAGMGLQNIKKCADSMNLDSVPGKGTQIEVEIFLRSDDESERDRTEASA